MRLCSPDSVSSDESVPSRIIPIKFHTKTGYSAYESAPSDVRFSEDHIEQLTVGHLMALDFNIPLALPDDTVKLVGWSPEEPTTSQFLLADGKIPSLDDVRAFLSNQLIMFREGFRSVVIEAQGMISRSLDY
jgi:hypothetical protein